MNLFKARKIKHVSSQLPRKIDSKLIKTKRTTIALIATAFTQLITSMKSSTHQWRTLQILFHRHLHFRQTMLLKLVDSIRFMHRVHQVRILILRVASFRSIDRSNRVLVFSAGVEMLLQWHPQRSIERKANKTRIIKIEMGILWCLKYEIISVCLCVFFWGWF